MKFENKNIKRTVWTVVLSTLVVGFISLCVDPFDPEISGEDSVDLLVVDGLITDQPGPYEVYLSRTVPLDTAFYENPEREAVVKIYDDEGGEELLVEEEDGVYRTSENGIQGEIGRSYTLHIVTTDGREYESSAVKIEPVPSIDRIYFEEFEKTNYELNGITERWLGIYLDSNGKADENRYYRWTYEEDWEYNMTEVGEINIPDDIEIPSERTNCWQSEVSRAILVKTTENQSVNRLNKINITSIPPSQQKLSSKYSIEVLQYSINKELYRFFDRLKQVNEEGGGLYDQIPSAVYGNVHSRDGGENALGCFQASAVATKRIFIDRNDHDIEVELPFSGCLFDTIPDTPEAIQSYIDNYMVIYIVGKLKQFSYPALLVTRDSECFDCRVNGTSERPPFWE